MINNLSKNIIWAIATFLIIAILFSFFYSQQKQEAVLNLDQLAQKINAEEVAKITVSGDSLEIELKNGEKFTSKKEAEVGLTETLKNYGVDSVKLQKTSFIVKEESGLNFWLSILIPSLLPLIIIGVFFWLMFRQARTGMSQAFTFGKANIKLFSQFKDRITFKDVAGLKEAKEELMEVVDFLKNPKKYLEIGAKIPRGVLLFGAPGTGKCITGDSLIFTNKGLIEIKDIPKYFWVDQETNEVKGAELPTINIENTNRENHSASHWYDLGEQDTMKITLRQGIALEGTPEHPIAIIQNNGRLGWKNLSEINSGDVVAIKFNNQSFGNLREIDLEQAYLMGLLTGDGNLSHSSRVGFTTTDVELSVFFKNFVNEHYPDAKVGIASDKITQVVSSWAIKRDLYCSGMSYLLSYDKIIPPSIMMAPKEIITAFVQGLFDTDGYFERYNVGYATVSKKLADQLMAILLNFGIVAKLRLKAKAGTIGHPRNVYEIIISGVSLVIFAHSIGFRLKRKQAAIEHYLATHAIGNTNVDVFPYIFPLVNDCWQALRLKQKSSEQLARIIDKVRQRERISRRSLQLFIAEYEKSGVLCGSGEYLKSLLAAQLFFSPVEKIEHSRARVYDFTVPQAHSFISNGIISHNTLLARAVAGEANVPFFHISGSEFVEMFVGVGASIKGDELVLIRENNEVKLLPIKDVIDKYYQENQSDIAVSVSGLETLGVAKKETNFWGFKNNKEKFLFGGSKWTKVQKIYRHKTKEIYEIHYRGGKIETTGDHSIFIREKNYIKAKRADELKPGEILVNLPFKTRSVFIPGVGTTHKIKAHNFAEAQEFELDLFDNRLNEELMKYNFVMESRTVLSQAAIAQKIGVSQATVKNWQLGYHQPRFFNANILINQTSPRLKITSELMRLLGYYTAEGRTTAYYTQFVFGSHEKELQKDCINLIKNIFKIEPNITDVKKSNSTRINISSPIIAMFFERHCGNGSHNKHLPQFIWELSFEHVKEYLRGYSLGDGYITKDGKLSITSVSEKIIRELTWLLAMHGIKAGVKKSITPAGRIIKNRLLPETTAWNLIIGKTSNIWSDKSRFQKSPNQFKKPVITKIIKKDYDGYVYDFCGCENEAFFAGNKPLLVHNSRVRDLFATAKKAGRSIIFIDEIDAVGRERGAGLGGGHDEREQTLNQILVEMDGFERDDQRIVIAASNRPDVLDPALLRPGRFDRRVILDLPDISDREEILKIHAKGKVLAKDINLRRVAERTPGFSGADLANLMNEAALLAAKKNQLFVSQMDIFSSIEKVLLGPERRSRVLSQKEKEITAYHEAGHALVAASLKGADPVHKVSIVARGRAGGYTLKLPIEETHLRTKAQFMTDLAVMLGGYISEQVVFGDVSTGASNDLQNASGLARKLVTKFGMSKKLGPITFGKTEEMIFLGREITTEKNYSESVAKEIDNEVKGFIEKAHEAAKKIINSRKKVLEKIAKTLMEKETLEQEEFANIIKGFHLKPVAIK